MKKTVKLVSILLLTAMVVMALTTIVNAGTTGNPIDPANMAENLKGTTTNAQTSVQTIGNQLIGIITTVGVVVAVIVLLILGIKYMMGSASEKAEYKKTMIPYLVGAILIFGASAITKVVVSLATGIQA